MSKSKNNPKAKLLRIVVSICILLIAGYFGIDLTNSSDSKQTSTQQTSNKAAPVPNSASKLGNSNAAPAAISLSESQSDLAALMSSEQSGIMVEFSARVVKILNDDNDGARHQRFLLGIDNSRAPSSSILVAHNIDLAPRVPLDEGSIIRIYGQYEWNDRGGVIHWTHHDPGGRHAEGWIELDDIRYD